MYTYFESYLGICSIEEDQTHKGATQHIAYTTHYLHYTLPILYCQCHISWCLGDLKNHRITKHSIDQINQNIPSLYQSMPSFSECAQVCALFTHILNVFVLPHIYNAVYCWVCNNFIEMIRHLWLIWQVYIYLAPWHFHICWQKFHLGIICHRDRWH